ncbi:MAG: type III secretion system chaperone [Achromobacter sp.]|uniref:type III secretion system chaperone n=1 Tax=Achromobacter sp. TaxID=134375 RepID=UPI003CFEFA18
MSQDRYLALLNAYARHRPAHAEVARTQQVVIDGRAVGLWCVPAAADADPGDGLLVCRTDVARFAQGLPGAVCRLLLQANNLWAGTHGATLGLRGHDTVMLSAARRIGSLTPASLDALLAGLLVDAQTWTAQLTRRATPAAAGAEAGMLHLRA